jgi:NIPSNAP
LTAGAALPKFGPAANPTDKEITAMLYELRTYYAMPGRLPDISRRFADITMGYFKQYDIQVVGFWTNELGGSSEQLIYMLGWESLADREKKWSAFAADKERLAKFAETEKNGPLISRLTAQILRPTSYSPMK